MMSLVHLISSYYEVVMTGRARLQAAQRATFRRNSWLETGERETERRGKKRRVRSKVTLNGGLLTALHWSRVSSDLLFVSWFDLLLVYSSPKHPCIEWLHLVAVIYLQVDNDSWQVSKRNKLLRWLCSQESGNCSSERRIHRMNRRRSSE